MTDDILDLFRQGHGAAVVITAFLLLHVSGESAYVRARQCLAPTS